MAKAALRTPLLGGEREINGLMPGEIIQAVSWSIYPPSKLRVGMRADAGYTAAFYYVGAVKQDRPWTEQQMWKAMYQQGWEPSDPVLKKAFLKAVKT